MYLMFQANHDWSFQFSESSFLENLKKKNQKMQSVSGPSD